MSIHTQPVFSLGSGTLGPPRRVKAARGPTQSVRAAPPSLGPSRACVGLDRWGRLRRPEPGLQALSPIHLTQC